MSDETKAQLRRNSAMHWMSGASAIALATMLAGAAVAEQPVTTQEGDDAEDSQAGVEVIRVQGIRSSLRSSQEIRRDSEVVVDSITAEDIGALPDRSVTEALQRVPGVSIDRFRAGVDPDHFSIEGSGVVVRGLTWVRSELNGRDTFTANNGRILSFSDVPSELMGGVDVFKSPSADMIEGGISGTINLRTRVPFDSGGRVIAGSVEGSYGDFAERWAPTASVLFSDRFETANAGEFGFLINAVHSELVARSDGQQISNFGERTLYSNGDVVPTDGATEVGQVWFPRGAAFRSQIFERERTGLGASGQWRSPDRTMIATAQFLRSDSRQAWTEHAIEIATDNVADNGDSRAIPGTTLEFGSNGVFTRGAITSDNTGWRDDQFGASPRSPAWGLQSNNIRRDVVQDYVTTDYGLNFRWTPNDRWSFNFDYQHVDSKVDVLDFTLWNSTYQDVEIEMRGTDIPVVNFLPLPRRTPDGALCTAPDPENDIQCPEYRRAGNEAYSDPFNSFTRSAMDHIERSRGRQDAFRFDADYSFSEDSWIDSVRFGARRSIRNQTTRFTEYNWGAVSEQWGGGGPVWLDGTVPGVGALADYHSPFNFSNFMRGKVPVPTGEDPRLFWAHHTVDRYAQMSDYALGVGDSWRTGVDEFGCALNWTPLAQRCGVTEGPFRPQEINPVREETDALYAMMRFRTNLAEGVELSGNVGVRYVNMERESSGFIAFQNQSFTTEAECANQQSDPDQTPSAFCMLDPQVRADARAFQNGALIENDARHTETYWLPSFNAVARLDNGWQFRLGVSRAITPPNIGLTRNFYNITLGTNEEDIVDGRPRGTFGIGNPFLKPIMATNVDVAAEWYFADVGSVTLSLFHKRLEDVHTNSTTLETFTNNGATFDAVVSMPVNSDETGTVKGFELAYQQTYDFLPAPFDGFGLSANYTYVDSDGVAQTTLSETDPDVAAGRVANIDTSLLPLQGLSEHTVNLAGFYEKGPWSLRLAYAWRSDFVVTVRDVIVPFAPIIQEDSGQLDGSIFYSVNDNIRVGMQAVNLTNEVTRTSQVLNNDLLTAPRSWFMNDRRFTFIVRGTF
jgi:TonB-dependent receptor